MSTNEEIEKKLPVCHNSFSLQLSNFVNILDTSNCADRSFTMVFLSEYVHFLIMQCQYINFRNHDTQYLYYSLDLSYTDI